ncbi:uncharacterized protein SPSK_04747 [Sporothrix schenckii 1099-18]|uniref:Uncharacterized protein n=1 Tax=Sporothrix schenckii 1099-18 TaxID=1397361 RepID=A0A0F2M3W1_SPOSC|nr:uncharacterized protein SPSK_04747 [Sporothrix schenckii 1099-18]KJR83455.1 hypothetical protein SPSK_04747 [Sporothrix schenckii 1099-18]
MQNARQGQMASRRQIKRGKQAEKTKKGTRGFEDAAGGRSSEGREPMERGVEEKGRRKASRFLWLRHSGVSKQNGMEEG